MQDSASLVGNQHLHVVVDQRHTHGHCVNQVLQESSLLYSAALVFNQQVVPVLAVADVGVGRQQTAIGKRYADDMKGDAVWARPLEIAGRPLACQSHAFVDDLYRVSGSKYSALGVETVDAFQRCARLEEFFGHT